MANSVLQSSETNEWYTPQYIIDRVESTLGGIELDPASCQKAQQTVQADRYFGRGGEVEDGLSVDWRADTLFTNPPYGRDENFRSNVTKWSEYLFDQWVAGHVNSAILLTFAHPSRQWFYPFWNFPVCFLYKRIKFERSDGSTGNSPPHCNAITYLPPKGTEDFDRFYQTWQEHGQIFDPVKQGKRSFEDYQLREFL